MDKIRRRFIIEGIVQGVGFRPFIYRLAINNNLNGWVKNSTEGVVVEIEGELKGAKKFQEGLTKHTPPLARVYKIIIKNIPTKNDTIFTIKQSNCDSNSVTIISPDIASCSNCLEEIKDPGDRRFRYPFTNCTDCGPRYSIIEEMPYDRPATTMKSFEMCSECREEYEAPRDRRFHAQPNACPNCGPQLWLTDKSGKKIEVKDPIGQVVNMLSEGKIVALKGLGGFHLACDAKNQAVIENLRIGKRRPDKPLAVMMKNLKVVNKYCYVSSHEEKILKGIKKPILLLKRKNRRLPDNIAPDNNYLGVMLPYSPFHELLFDDDLELLIMTSANLSGRPIEYTNQGILNRLGAITDNFLLHNRDIKIPVDDSVVRVIFDQEYLIRSARGYAPLVIKFDKKLVESLACGADLKNTIAVAKDNYIFISQHLGDLGNLDSYQNYRKVVNHFKNIYQFNPKITAHDLHPNYISSRFAQTQPGEKTAIQHHHAHIVSCMVDNQINEKVIGLAFDGAGLGNDGKIWGGEFLICNFTDFKRVGHLNYVKMPGGEKAVEEPWRMAVSYLYHTYGNSIELIDELLNINRENIERIIRLIRKDVNSPKTSSLGRFFAAIASILGLSNTISYQAQAAIRLENIVTNQKNGYYRYLLEQEGDRYIVNTKTIIKDIVEDISLGTDIEVIAKKFHNTIVNFSVELCELIKKRYKVNKVALSGGVFQNKIILEGIYHRLKKRGFEVYFHNKVPCNDAGISLGQLVSSIYRKEERS